MRSGSGGGHRIRIGPACMAALPGIRAIGPFTVVDTAPHRSGESGVDGPLHARPGIASCMRPPAAPPDRHGHRQSAIGTACHAGIASPSPQPSHEAPAGFGHAEPGIRNALFTFLCPAAPHPATVPAGQSRTVPSRSILFRSAASAARCRSLPGSAGGAHAAAAVQARDHRAPHTATPDARTRRCGGCAA